MSRSFGTYFNSRLALKQSIDLRGCFSQFKDDNADGLSLGKEKDAEMRKADRKDGGGFEVN